MTLEELFNRPEKKQPGAREEATDAAIREQFLHLLKKKSIEKISVAELCQRCGINRSTFYRHYSDLYALLEAIAAQAHERLFYDVLQTVDTSEDFEQVGYQYIYRVCEVTEQDKELYKLLLYGKTPTSLRERMTESAYRLYELAHEGPTNLHPAKEAKLHYRFLASGMIGVWAAWVQEDCRTPKAAVAKAMRQQISGFYGTMWDLFGKGREE